MHKSPTTGPVLSLLNPVHDPRSSFWQISQLLVHWPVHILKCCDKRQKLFNIEYRGYMLIEEWTHTAHTCNLLFGRAKIFEQKVMLELSSFDLIFSFIDTPIGRWNWSVREGLDPPVLSICTGCSASSPRHCSLYVRTHSSDEYGA